MPVKVMIDPGHGGQSKGATGYGLVEKNVNLDLAKRTARCLQASYDVDIRLTRETDSFVSLHERTAAANDWQADLFLSIHCNAGGGTGFESYIHPDAFSKTVSVRQTVHQTLASMYRKAGFPDRGMKRARFYVLGETAMPAVLTENLFLDRAEDAAFLKKDEHRRQIAWAHCDGVGAAFALPKEQRTPILGSAQINVQQATGWLVNRGTPSDWVDMARRTWRIVPFFGIRPEVALALMSKETGFFHFGGQVEAAQNNVGGLKTADGSGFASFDSRNAGIAAVAEHLYAYASQKPIPQWIQNIDPRWDAVVQRFGRGSVTVVEELSGTWAEDPNYGQSLVEDYLQPMLGI